MTPTLLDVALAHAAAGRRVFPCDPETKVPMVTEWDERATTDPETIRAWWTHRPHALPGWALPPELGCVDIDPRNGGVASAKRLELPETRTVRTGGGGLHFFYLVPPERPIKNGPLDKSPGYADFDGIDVKTAGGFVVLDGVTRADGGRYELLSGDAPIAPAPAWLLEAKARGGAPATEPDAPVIWQVGSDTQDAMTPAIVALLAPKLATKGARHEVARAVGGALAASGWDDESIRELVRQLPSTDPGARVTDALGAAERVRAGEPAPMFGALERLGYPAAVVAAVRTMAGGPALAAALESGATPNDAPKHVAPEVLTVASVYAKITPVDWTCEFLRLAAGAPTIVAGYGGAGKTLLVQTLVVCIVTGSPFFGHEVKKGRVRHYDYEQGARITLTRYQRIAAGMGLPDGALADGLEIVCGPEFRLTDAGARERLVSECEGCTLAVFDSLRASTDGDENESEIRKPLDMLFGVSEATRCAMLVIHHARKASKQNGAGGNQDMRGNSAINDAAQTVVMLKPNTSKDGFAVECGKAREGRAFKPFDVEITDPPVEHEGFNAQGLRLVLVDGDARGEEQHTAQLESDCQALVTLVRGQPGEVLDGGYRAFATRLPKLSEKRIRDSLALLESDKRLTNVGTVARPKWCIDRAR